MDRDFQRKTNELVQRRIGTAFQETVSQIVTLDQATLEAIREREEGKATKVINLVKAIAKSAEEQSNDPFLIAMAERARAVQESFEDRQSTTEEALATLLEEIRQDEQRRQLQAEKGLDGLTYFVLCKLHDEGIANAEAVSRRVREAFAEHATWRQGEKELRELRKKITFTIYAEEDNLDKVTALVDRIFTVLGKSECA